MCDFPRTPRRGLGWILLSLSFLGLGALAWGMRWTRPVSSGRVSDPAPVRLAAEASGEEIERTCGTCHAVPPPELYPKHLWPREVERGFQFLAQRQGWP